MRPLLYASSPAMSACFMAIAACRARGDDVHPVHVRNIGFYQTWQRCAAQREDGAAQLSAAVVLPAETGVHSIQGAYVFASTYKGKRAISIVAIYAAGRDEPLGISSLDFIIEDEQESLLSVIRRQCGGTVQSDSLLAQQTDLAQLCTKVFLYWAIEQARHVSLTPHGDALRRLQGMGPRKAAKLRRQTERLYDRVVLGPDTLPAHLRGVSGEMSPHWRRGHFRMQAHGPRLSLRKVMFISPTIVRADRLTIDEPP